MSHVGKIYTLLSYQMANRIANEAEAVEEVYVCLCSQIGRPIDAPRMASAQVLLAPGTCLGDVEPGIQDIMHAELGDLSHFIGRLVRGEVPVW